MLIYIIWISPQLKNNVILVLKDKESEIQTSSVTVMVNFMCLIVWTLMPRYLVKHVSESFCDGVFGWGIYLSWWILSKRDFPPYCEFASSNQLNVWIEQKGWHTGKQERILWQMTCRLHLQYCFFLIPQQTACGV